MQRYLIPKNEQLIDSGITEDSIRNVFYVSSLSKAIVLRNGIIDGE